MSTLPYEFAITVKLTSDTSKYTFIAIDNKDKSDTNKVTIYRTKKPIPASEAILTGTLYRPSSSPIAKKLAKKMIAMNAAGLKVEVDKILPLTGADVLVYSADSVSTANSRNRTLYLYSSTEGYKSRSSI